MINVSLLILHLIDFDCRRRSLDVKRLSMANEALMVAETLRKSVSPKTGGRGVSFSGQGQGDEMAAMMQVEGQNRIRINV